MQNEPFMVNVAKKPSPIQIALTPRFKKDLRELVKRYRSIRSDIKP
jgi:hypothetical protein